LAEEDRRNIVSGMEWNCGASSIGMPVLSMGPTLTN
jgi:hypothetical protein